MTSDMSKSRALELFGLLLLVAAMVVLCLVLAPAVHAQPLAGDILGNVTGADDGEPIAGATIQPFDASGMPYGDPATSDSLGDYLLPGLPEGNYRLLFTAMDGEHYIIYYLDQETLESATPVGVVGGGQTLGIDQAIPLGGSITGTVRAADTGDPLDPCTLNLYVVAWNHHGRVVTWIAETDAVSGVYRFQGLGPSLYLVESKSSDQIHYESWWWNNKSTEETATTVAVALSIETSNININVPAGGKITGMVQDADTNPIKDVTCAASYYNPSSKAWESAGNVTSNEFGYYSMGPVTPGSYKMQFAPSNDSHMGEFFDDKPDLEHATVFNVQMGQETGNIDAVLTRTAVVSGLVESDDDDHYPIEEVTVNAYRKVGNKWSLRYSEKTNRNAPADPPVWGTFEIKGMAPGTYILEYVPERPFWTKEFYANKPDTLTATQITLGDGAVKNDADARLAWAPENIEWYGVTPADSSDFGALLSSVGFGYSPLVLDTGTSYDLLNLSLLKRFRWVFINCSGVVAEGYAQLLADYNIAPTNSPLAEYVRNGGKLFISDHTGPPLKNDFYDGSDYPFTFALPNEQGKIQSMTADVVDAAMRTSIGSATVPITYDKGGTSVLLDVAPTATVNMRADVATDLEGTKLDVPICATVPFGTGKIVYQTFHLDKQSTDYAKKMLYYFLDRKPSPPKIDSCSPTSSPVNAIVTIKGTNFGSSKVSSSWVTFNNKKATSYPVWTAKEIQVKVPAGALTGPMWVTTGGGNSNKVTYTIRDAPEGAEWYLAEGSSDYGFDTYINIENPNGSTVTAQVEYMTGTGKVARPDITLPALSQTTINPRADLGAKDFSTKVKCKEGMQIAVDRRMIWTGSNAPSQEGHSSIGVTTPAPKWYLAEGSANWGFECWLLVQNPNSSPASLTVTYMIEGEGPVQKPKTVQANSRLTWSMGEDIGAKDASVMIQSDNSSIPIIAERAMYRFDKREGHESIGTAAPSKTYYLAEGTTGYGFTTYVLIQNPNPTTTNVTLTYMTNSGPKAQPAFPLAGNSRKTIRVNDIAEMKDKDFSTKVVGSQAIIAERAMYWGAGTPLGEACHDSIGMAAAHTKFFLPDGETQNGYETWTCVQNPNNEAVNIELNYYLPDGTKQAQPIPDTIPANSRKTYDMAQKIQNGKAAISVTCTSPGLKIMVERSMYWNSRGAGTNTIGGFADTL